MIIFQTGKTFLFSDRIVPSPHLWLVLTDPDGNPHGKIVTVMLCTKKEHSDLTLELDVGDHPFIRHPSTVQYGTARFMMTKNLTAAISNGNCLFQADMSKKLICRVQEGLLSSHFTPNFIKNYCEK